MFLVLSVLVFGSILYVGYVSVNTEIVVIGTAMEDVFTDDTDVRNEEYLITENPNLGSRRGAIELVPDHVPRESPVIRDDRPVEPKDVKPAAPIVGIDFTPRGPPVIRDSRLGDRLEPDYGVIVDPYEPGDAFIE